MAKRNRVKIHSGKSSAPDSRPPVPAKLSVLKWWLAAFAVLVIVSAFGWALSAPRESGAVSMAFPSPSATFKPTVMNTARPGGGGAAGEHEVRRNGSP
jgi:hypothetical protein